MAVNLTVNGVSYSYPELDDENWGAAATGWAQAVTAGMLQKAGGTFTLTADVNFGATYGLIVEYLKSNTSNVASTGEIRLANTDKIVWRNAANSDNLLLEINAADNHLLFNGFDISAASGGNVVGPGTSTDNALPRFDGTNGQLLQNSGVIIDDSNNVTGVLALTATGALVGASTNSTFADAVGTTMTSTGANAVATTRTRSTGTSVSAGGVAISSSSGSYTKTGTSFSDVTNLSVTITTSGRPVRLVLISGTTGNSGGFVELASGNPAQTGNLKFVRDSTDLAVIQLDTTAFDEVSQLAPGGFEHLDVVAAGTYTYKVQARTSNASVGVITVQDCKLVAYEL